MSVVELRVFADNIIGSACEGRCPNLNPPLRLYSGRLGYLQKGHQQSYGLGFDDSEETVKIYESGFLFGSPSGTHTSARDQEEVGRVRRHTEITIK